MSNNTITILDEEFENEKDGSKVRGITIIVDGKFKDVIDTLMVKKPEYQTYTEIIRDALFTGINKMIKE